MCCLSRCWPKVHGAVRDGALPTHHRLAAVLRAPHASLCTAASGAPATTPGAGDGAGTEGQEEMAPSEGQRGN